MKALAFIIAVVFAVTGASAVHADDRGTAGPVEKSLGEVIVLDLPEALAGVIKFHSRSAVTHSGTYKAQPSEVAVCERFVQGFFSSSPKLLPRQVKAYHRQYFGIKRGNRRLLYLNAFYSHRAPGKVFRETLVDSYDGGNNFWGLVCDPKTGDISEFESARIFRRHKSLRGCAHGKSIQVSS